MAKLTKKEREVLADLESKALNSVRHRTTLNVLCSLQEKGLIEFDPFAGTAKLTPSGEQHLR